MILTASFVIKIPEKLRECITITKKFLSKLMSTMHRNEKRAAQVQDQTKPKKNDWRKFEIGFKFPGNSWKSKEM